MQSQEGSCPLQGDGKEATTTHASSLGQHCFDKGKRWHFLCPLETGMQLNSSLAWWGWKIYSCFLFLLLMSVFVHVSVLLGTELQPFLFYI